MFWIWPYTLLLYFRASVQTQWDVRMRRIGVVACGPFLACFKHLSRDALLSPDMSTLLVCGIVNITGRQSKTQGRSMSLDPALRCMFQDRIEFILLVNKLDAYSWSSYDRKERISYAVLLHWDWFYEEELEIKSNWIIMNQTHAT